MGGEYFVDNNYNGKYEGTEVLVKSADAVLDTGDTILVKGTADITSFKAAGVLGAEYVFDDTLMNDNDFTVGEAIWKDNDGNKNISGGDTLANIGQTSLMNFNSPLDPAMILYNDNMMCGGTAAGVGIYERTEPIWDDKPSGDMIFTPGVDVILTDPSGCGVPLMPGVPFLFMVPLPAPFPPTTPVVFLDTDHNGVYTYTIGVSGEPIVYANPGCPLACNPFPMVPNGGPLLLATNPGGPEFVLPAFNGPALNIGGTYTNDWRPLSQAGIGPYYFIGSTAGADLYSLKDPIMKDNIVTDSKLDAGEIITNGTPASFINTWGTMMHDTAGNYVAVEDIYNDVGATLGSVDKKIDQLNALTIKNSGTAVNSDISQMKLWKDGGDNTFNNGGGDDTSIGVIAYDGVDSWDISGLTTTISAGGLRLYVTINTAASPTNSRTVNLYIPKKVDAGTAGTYQAGDLGVFVASTNDGPNDADVKAAANNTLTINTSLPPSGGTAVCGNSAIETGETCDDGGTTAGDGCSATCIIESTTPTPEEPAYDPVEGLTDEEVVDVADHFSDYTEAHWAAAYIAKLYLDGVITGYEDGTFGIGKKANRAEMIKIVLLANGITVAETVTTAPFPDVPADAWSAPYVTKGKELGIVEGYDDGNYKPDRAVNRVEALKMMLLGAGIDVSGADTSLIDFTDTDPAGWYVNYLAYAIANEIVSGYADNTFKPDNDVAREEIAKIAVKVMTLP